MHGPSLPRGHDSLRAGFKAQRGTLCPWLPHWSPRGLLPLPPPPSVTWECPGQVAVTGPHSPTLPGSPGSPAVGARRSHAHGFGGATRCRSQEARPAPSCFHHCRGGWGLNVPFPALCPEVLPGLSLAQGPSPADLEPRAAHLAAASLGWGLRPPAPPTFDVSALLSPQERTFLLLLPTWEPGTGPRCWVSWGPGRCWVGAAFPRWSQPGSSHGLSPHSTVSRPRERHTPLPHLPFWLLRRPCPRWAEPGRHRSAEAKNDEDKAGALPGTARLFAENSITTSVLPLLQLQPLSLKDKTN